MSEEERVGKFKPEDVVRIIAVPEGTQIAPYLGCEGRVLHNHPTEPLCIVEVDVGRATPDRGGQLGPRFIVREDCLDPDVTEKMLEAGLKAVIESPLGESAVASVYRAMRAARFER